MSSSPTVNKITFASAAGTLTLNNGTISVWDPIALTSGYAQTLNGTATINGPSGLTNGAELTINSSNILGGTLTINGDVNSVSGTIKPTAGGTLAIGGSLSSTGTLTYTLGTSSSLITAGAINGVLTGTVSVTAGSGFGIGTYNLITPPSGTWGGAAQGTLTPSGMPAIFTTGAATITYSNSAIALNVTRNTTAYTFNWAGGSSGTWATASNWTYGGASYTGVYPGLVATDTAAIDLSGQSSPTITMTAPRRLAPCR